MSSAVLGRSDRTATDGIRRRRLALDWELFSFHAILVIAPMIGIAQALGAIHEPIDFNFYWRATNFDDLYPATWLDPTYAYVYPPPLAQLLFPLHVLPHDVVLVGWTIVCFLSLWYCAREWTLLVLLVGLVSLYLPNGHVLGAGLNAVLLGNVQMPLAAGIVAGMRHPGWWAIPILTKITTGVGVVWYAFRGEWRAFRLAIAVTAVVVIISFVLAPAAWGEYVAWVVDNNGKPSKPPIVGPPLPLRVAAALALVWWGSRRNHPWVVALAGGLAIPGLYGWTSIASISLGALALRRPDRPSRIALGRRPSMRGSGGAARPQAAR